MAALEATEDIVEDREAPDLAEAIPGPLWVVQCTTGPLWAAECITILPWAAECGTSPLAAADAAAACSP